MKHHLLSVTFAAFGLAALSSSVIADEVNLKWLPDGASEKFRYYAPMKLRLSAEQPAALKKAPSDLQKPLYGTITVGPKESPQKILLLLDESSSGDQRLWVDANNNGDLTDDTPAKWNARTNTRGGKQTTMHDGSARFVINYGSDHREVQIRLYRFDPKERADASTTLLYYRDWGYQGTVTLGDQTYPAMMDDINATGDFRGKEGPRSGVALLIDVNHDGQFDSKSETFDVLKPFNIGGTTYEVSGLNASGSGVTIAKSNKTVDETKPLAVLSPGGKPVSFEAKTTTGQTIRFPDDYKGKVVLLDFWATWCGPCRAELPNVKKVYEDFHRKGFEILAVSLDSADSLDKLAKFTKDNDMPWPQICDGKAWDAELANKYAVRGIPAGFLVNGTTGLIAALGNSLRGEGLRTEVQKALGGSSVSLTPSKPDKTPEPKPQAAETDPLVAKAEAAAKEGKLLSDKAFMELRSKPDHSPVVLPKAATGPLSGRQVAKLAKESYLRVGWFYHCTRCDHWHLKLCGAYPIAEDAVATAWHVSNAPATLKEGSFVVIDSAGTFLKITGVIGGSAASDTIVLRVRGANLKPLALNDAIEIGDSAYLFSEPLQQKNYFSSGIVNRLHLLNDNGAKSTEGAPAADLRLNVSTDWAPGSSGAAVLDQCGNVIGHVATINPLFESTPNANDPNHKEDRFHNAPLMTLHDAIPAATVKSVLKP